MQTYFVTITYTEETIHGTTTNTLSFYKKSNSASMAISVSSSLFGSLMNFKGTDNLNRYVITSITATYVSSDSSDEPEPEPEPDVTPENTNLEDNTEENTNTEE